LTFLGAGEAPVWSPDGQRVAFTIDKRIDGQLVAVEVWITNADGSGLSMLASGWEPAWSPDGQRIAFSRGIGPEWDAPGIYIIDTDGSNLVRVASSGGGPSWSPDGSRILFTDYVEGKGQIMIINADGSGLTRLTDGERPVWSPDGTRIAFTAWADGSAEARQELCFVNVDGSGRIRVAATDGRPVWSPDGRRLAVVSAVERGYEIEIVDTYKWERSYLADGMMPAWSPDGSHVAFVSTLPGESFGQVFVIDADGSNLTRVSDFDVGHAGSVGQTIEDGGGPAWSSDGQHIVYVLQREGLQELFVVRPNGSGLKRIAEGGYPAWAPVPR
jgi:Tol biopolymer transport system component